MLGTLACALATVVHSIEVDGSELETPYDTLLQIKQSIRTTRKAYGKFRSKC